MPDWTAITGIVVAGVVGPTVAAVLAAKRQAREHTHERWMGDLADLRALLADSARDLRRVEGLIGATASLLLTWGDKLPEQQPDHLENFRAAGRDTAENDARIALRLPGDSEIAQAHHDAYSAVNRASGAIGLVGGLGGADLRESWAEIKAAREALSDARERFLRASRAQVGTRSAP